MHKQAITASPPIRSSSHWRNKPRRRHRAAAVTRSSRYRKGQMENESVEQYSTWSVARTFWGFVNNCRCFLISQRLGRSLLGNVFAMQIRTLLSSKMDELRRWAEGCRRGTGRGEMCLTSPHPPPHSHFPLHAHHFPVACARVVLHVNQSPPSPPTPISALVPFVFPISSRSCANVCTFIHHRFHSAFLLPFSPRVGHSHLYIQENSLSSQNTKAFSNLCAFI